MWRRPIVCQVKHQNWQMLFYLDLHSKFFVATGPNCFIVLCKILLPGKLFDKSISWWPKRPSKQRRTSFLLDDVITLRTSKRYITIFHRAAKRRGKYQQLATETEVNNIGHKRLHFTIINARQNYKLAPLALLPSLRENNNHNNIYGCIISIFL